MTWNMDLMRRFFEPSPAMDAAFEDMRRQAAKNIAALLERGDEKIVPRLPRAMAAAWERTGGAEMNKWQPIETAPDFEDVLVSVSGMVAIGHRRRDIGWFCSTTGSKYHGSTDGWQPLPAAATPTPPAA